MSNVVRGDTAICVSTPAGPTGHSLMHLNLGAMCKVLQVINHGPTFLLWEVECLTHWVALHQHNRNVEITAGPGSRIAVMDCRLRPLRYEMGLDETLQWSGYPPSPTLELKPGRPFAQFSDKALRSIGKRLGFDPKF